MPEENILNSEGEQIGIELPPENPIDDGIVVPVSPEENN